MTLFSEFPIVCWLISRVFRRDTIFCIVRGNSTIATLSLAHRNISIIYYWKQNAYENKFLFSVEVDL